MIISVLTCAVTLGIVAGLGAQEKAPAPRREPAPMRRPATERDGCVTTDGRTECTFMRRADADSILMKRPVIGVQLSPTGTARDTLGVFVSRVTPKGPAENAGIVEGDRIVAINGVDLRVNAADAGDSYAAGLPSRRLTREVAKLSPGRVATLRVSSGGRVRDVSVTVGRASDFREGSGFGYFGEGGREGVFRAMPNMENLRTRIRAMPGEQMDEMDFPRNFEGMDRLRIEQLAPLRDGEKFRVLSPSRVRVLRGHGDLIVGRDSQVIFERALSEKEKVVREKAVAAEKAKAGKKK